MTSPTVPARPQDAAERIRAVGLRVTDSRRAVVDALSTRPHASADEVFALVAESVPQTSLQSVYNALGDFADAGLVRRIEPAGRPGLFELRVDEATAKLCASMPLAELPAERVFGEIEKLLLKARRPSIGLALLEQWRMLKVVAPELVPLRSTPQDPEWHPEGDVWTHTLQVVDEAASLLGGLEHDRPRRLAVMLGALCHDLGKPPTTKFEEGRVRSRGHEEAGVPPTESLLDRWNVHTLLGYDVRAQVLALVAQHLKPGQLYDDRERVSDGAIRRLARKVEADLLYRVARADCLGRRPGKFEPVAMEWFREKVRALDVAMRPPEPLLKGRDLLELGMSPGPAMGKLLQAVYELQLDGAVRTLDDAREQARRILAAER